MSNLKRYYKKVTQNENNIKSVGICVEGKDNS